MYCDQARPGPAPPGSSAAQDDLFLTSSFISKYTPRRGEAAPGRRITGQRSEGNTSGKKKSLCSAAARSRRDPAPAPVGDYLGSKSTRASRSIVEYAREHTSYDTVSSLSSFRTSRQKSWGPMGSRTSIQDQVGVSENV